MAAMCMVELETSIAMVNLDTCRVCTVSFDLVNW